MNNEASKWACRKHLDSQIWPSGDKSGLETNIIKLSPLGWIESHGNKWDYLWGRECGVRCYEGQGLNTHRDETSLGRGVQRRSQSGRKRTRRSPSPRRGSRWREYGRKKERSSCQMLPRGQCNWSWTGLLWFCRKKVIGVFGECTSPGKWWGQKVGWRVTELNKWEQT